MRSRHSFYEILKYPIEVLFIAWIMIGIGNLLSNGSLGIVYSIENDTIIILAEMLVKAGQFLVVNFPFIFLIRLSARQTGSATSIISSVCGYISYLTATMVFASGSLPSTAYSSIFGLSISNSASAALSHSTHYPLQTGMIGAFIVAMITLWSFNRSKVRNEYGLFSFISKEASVTLRTVFVSFLAGAGAALVWPYVLMVIQKVISFIASDTTNPVNLALYGITDRFLGVFNLGTLIRQPFWYGVSGGSWNNIAGVSVAGDVNIWTSQLSSTGLIGMAGRFITPYYVLNIFAVPGMILGMYTLMSNRLERGRKRIFFLIATLTSIMFGTLLPLELLLVVLCPLLFLFHLGYTGILYGLFQALHVYLGFKSTDGSTLAAMPGTFPELFSYLSNSSLTKSLIVVAAVGAVSFVIYFGATQIYFRYVAVDLFRTGDKDRLIQGTIEAVGGLENIKSVYSSITTLNISVYDPNVINVRALRRLGSHKVYETRSGYTICYGAPSKMVEIGIGKALHDDIRNV
ncbi:MAG: PTS transporter subunit EIIB [Solobacterium sp.]|nr:PTS transporter subunit EIIB [Solobacterium sp.]